MKALPSFTSSNYLWYWVIGTFALGVILGRGPLSGHEPHHLFIYPDKENLKRWVECGDFGNIEAARASARAWMSYFPDGDYEIGVGKPKDWLGIKVYRETVR